MNEVTGIDTINNNSSIHGINSSNSNNHFVSSSFPFHLQQSQIAINSIDSPNNNINNINPDDSEFFGIEEFYNENNNNNYDDELINPIIQQLQQNPGVTIDTLILNLNSVINNEKNSLINSLTDFSNNNKNFKKFKEDYLSQYKKKKKEFENSYKSKFLDGIKDKLSDDKTIEIEFSDNKIIKCDLKDLIKYPYSKLSTYFTSLENIPKRNGRFFLDRNHKAFLQVLDFIKTEKIPNFTKKNGKKLFLDELHYWGINIKIEQKENLIFDKNFCPKYFMLNKSNNILQKANHFSGIVLLKRQLSYNNPYIEFYISLENTCSKHKIYFALVDSSKFKTKYLNSSFNKNVPFIFLWDIFGNKLFKPNTEKVKNMDLSKECKCYMSYNVTKFGLKYNHFENSVELFRNDINLGVEVKNIPPFLTPAIEINVEECKIQLLNNNDQQSKIFI